MKELQLSDLLPLGPYNGIVVEAVIDARPFEVERLVREGEIKLATGARRYLEEVLDEVVKDKRA